MQPQQDGFGRVVSEFALRARRPRPCDDPPSETVRLLLGDVAGPLLARQHQGFTPRRCMDLAKVDPTMRRVLRPDLRDVATALQPDPAERRGFANDRRNPLPKLGDRTEVLRSIRPESSVGSVDREPGSQTHVDGEKVPLRRRWRIDANGVGRTIPVPFLVSISPLSTAFPVVSVGLPTHGSASTARSSTRIDRRGSRGPSISVRSRSSPVADQSRRMRCHPDRKGLCRNRRLVDDSQETRSESRNVTVTSPSVAKCMPKTPSRGIRSSPSNRTCRLSSRSDGETAIRSTIPDWIEWLSVSR